MKQHELRSPKGARRTSKRLGRGNSSKGNYSGKGMKGQKSRSGVNMRPGFEGGQIPMVLKLPTRRGFTNIFRREYAVVNLEQLARFPTGSRVTPQELKDMGILKNTKRHVKVLGNGKLERPLTVVAHRFSKSARAAIEATGGAVEQL